MSNRLEGSSNIRSTLKRPAGLKQLKDEFFSLAAHEIRTPITVIKAQAQLAERFHAQGRLQGELIEKTLRTFVQESDRLARLCNDLLDIARLDNDCFEVHSSEFNIADVIRDAVAKVAPKQPDHPIRVVVSEGGVSPVAADHERTHNILGNLLGNAVRFSPNGGEIVVTVHEDGGRAVVAVRDQGVGIPADKIKNIFRRYYQAHQSGLKGPYGLGLGLYLCRETLRRMGGSIRVRSEGAGKGAEFTFTLPLAKKINVSKQQASEGKDGGSSND